MRMAAESNTERRALVFSMRQALSAQPAPLVRGSSRRITIMRFRPANIRVINRRDDRLGRRPHCFPLAREEQHKPTPRMYLTGSSISDTQAKRPPPSVNSAVGACPFRTLAEYSGRKSRLRSSAEYSRWTPSGRRPSERVLGTRCAG